MALSPAAQLNQQGIPNQAASTIASIAVAGTANKAQVTALVALTDSSGGTPSDTIVDVPASYTEATLANQLSSLATKINQIIAALKA